MATSPLPSRGPKRGRNYHITLAFSGVPNAKLAVKMRKGSLSPAFSGAQKKAALLYNHCILRVPQRQVRRQNQKWLPHPCLLRGPKEGRNATYGAAFSGSPTPRTATKSVVDTSPLPSRGPIRGRNCYVTRAVTGLPNAKKRDQFRSGYLTPAFSGAKSRAEMLPNACILGGPQCQERGQNQKWLPHPCLLGGQEVGGFAT